jgi:hypothetical protein
MNPTNAIYEILDAYVTSAASSDSLFEAELHGDSYENFGQGLTVRVGDVFGSELLPTGDFEVEEDNALIDVHIVKMPVSDEREHRFEARAEADEAAKQVAKVLWFSEDLRGLCTIGRIFKRNDWIMPATIRMPVTTLRIEVNSR